MTACRTRNIWMLSDQHGACLQKVQGAFPAATVTVAMCSIPPRKGKSPSVAKYNDNVTSVNKYVEKLSERADNVEYMDNNSVFLNNANKVKKAMYSDSDSSGIHLSIGGQKALREVLMNYLPDVDDITDSRKRQRSNGSTPGSAKKPVKLSKDS